VFEKFKKLNLLMKIEIFQACLLHIAYSNSYEIILNFRLTNDNVFSLTIEENFRYFIQAEARNGHQSKNLK